MSLTGLRLIYSRRETPCCRSKVASPTPSPDWTQETAQIEAITRDLSELLQRSPGHVAAVALMVRRILEDAGGW
ncbi:MAG: hypothetical protein NUW22_15695 [Acidobacteria bacterium]|nr:hypothetical protein [Acidobacteriota bacterium]